MSTTVGYAQPWIDQYNSLLQTYRTETGIDYRSWKNNSKDIEKLNRIVKQIGLNPAPDTNDHAELAYYANAYNILVLHGVLSEYPIKSVKDIAAHFGFFSQPLFMLAGEKVSLNHIEKKLLLKQFGEPRIHFIINCASISCPPLPAQALTAENLKQVMDSSTRKFLNQNPTGLQQSTDGSIQVSKVFDWYQNDFKAAGGIRSFINSYLKTPLTKQTKLHYKDYDWNLNQSQ